MAKPYKRKDSRYWYIAPWIQGKQVPQSSGTTDYERAANRLKVLEGKVASGAPIYPRTDRGVFSELLELVRYDYKVHRRASLYDVENRIDLHLDPSMGHLPTGKVTSGIIKEYILERRHANAAAATVNRELAIIKRAFRLGTREGLVSSTPHIDMLQEVNTRKGFFSDDAFNAVVEQSNELLKDILITAYRTGWRIDSIFHLEWRQVDLTEGAIRLYAEQTKNRKDCYFPIDLFPELRSMLERRRREWKASPKTTRVFHRDGEPIKDIRKAWKNAKDDAGLPDRLMHDFRRTAVRNLKKLGYSDSEVMNMVGIKTLSMFLRYNITTEEDVWDRTKAIIAARAKPKKTRKARA
jgi:integrase